MVRGEIMRFYKPLDKILDQADKVRILRFFVKTGAEWTGRQISKEIKISPATCHKVLRELHKEGVLLFRSVGSGHLYKLNAAHYLVKNVLAPLFDGESAGYARLKEILLKRLGRADAKKLVSAVVFGSVSKKTEAAKSDIDILLLVKNEKDKAAIEQKMTEAGDAIIREFGNAFSPYIQTVGEFKSKQSKKLPLVEEILKNNFLIAGKELKDI
ncbi:MAG: hypothetical protein COZ72_00710 [Elusimicrobia bacterium CG_4_8_14_3_um_filter_50_9]|nr:MAG: hypothetical protein COZ72_00710 [Elusimicrobia bacterium CG_4_8_14_3_um_filter_50_9]